MDRIRKMHIKLVIANLIYNLPYYGLCVKDKVEKPILRDFAFSPPGEKFPCNSRGNSNLSGEKRGEQPEKHLDVNFMLADLNKNHQRKPIDFLRVRGYYNSVI